MYFRPSWLLIVVACLFLSSQALAGEGGYAGPKKCEECHPDMVKAFALNVHSHAGNWVSSYQSCETCHGPGEAHAQSGDPSLIKNPLKMKASDLNAICLGCHEKGKLALWKGSTHESRGLACIDCHQMHGNRRKLLKADAELDVCTRCHGDIKAEIWKSSHHPIREGKMTCTSCHNPHGAIAPDLIDANTINEKCYECHAEKRGPYLWEHKPAVEDCTNCHTPHGSNHDKLLVNKVPWLCQSCHSGSRHPGTPYAVNPTEPAGTVYQNVGLQGIYRACLNCHPNIHGSNSPSGQYFTR